MKTLTESIIANRKRFRAATDRQTIESDLSWQAQAGHAILTPADPRYPESLKAIADPPLALYVKGSSIHLSSRQLAIVGSRNPSPTGYELAEHFASELIQSGLAVTSGLALGIDGAAHEGALDAKGITLAVLGHGLKTIYPKRHIRLAQRIAEQGALISEFPLELASRPFHFPMRNRLISGMTQGTLVIEAALKSGSLITARLAADQGREVFAIPGSPYNPLARGCHALIREGAKLVENIEDILEELCLIQGEETCDQPSINTEADSFLARKEPKSSSKLEEGQKQLLECIAFETTSVDQIIYRSTLSAQKVSAMLLNLELHGYIRCVPGGYRRLNRLQK